MAIQDLSSLDRTVFQPLGRLLQEAFSDGINCDVPIAPNKAVTCLTDHLLIKTTLDGKNVRINSRDYTQTSGSISAVQSKPNATEDGTLMMYGFECSPRFQDGIGGTGISCFFANPDLKGTTGDITGILRCFEGKLESASGSTRTVADAAVLHAMQALHGTLTDGPYVIKVDAAGGGVAWKAVMDLAADTGIAAYSAGHYSSLGNVDGKITVVVDGHTLLIPAYDTIA